PLSFRQAKPYAAVARLIERSGPLARALGRTRVRDLLGLARIHRTYARMNASDKVYVAAINGIALGMAAILALQCDLRLMAEGDEYAIGLIETGISILPAAGGTQRLVRMVGQSRAAELVLEGHWMTPTEAADIGLVHRVVPKDELESEALRVAQRLAGRSHALNREIKRMVYDAGARPFRVGARMEAASMIAVMSTPRRSE